MNKGTPYTGAVCIAERPGKGLGNKKEMFLIEGLNGKCLKKKKKKTDGLLVLRDEERETESLAAETERTQAVPQLKRHPLSDSKPDLVWGLRYFLLEQP